MHVRVRGIDASTGTYRLFVRREPTEGICAQDLQEPPGERNDSPGSASALLEDGAVRTALNNASLCNLDEDARDEDWYRFEVAEEGTRLCATAGFRHRNGNVDLELFRIGAQGAPCEARADCEGSAVCVEGRCLAALVEGVSRNDGEFAQLPKSGVAAGSYLLRLFSPDGDQNGYDLRLTVVPPPVGGDPCPRDHREVEGDNDDIRSASALGSGRTTVCDAWICEEERGRGDWYQILVPPGADRTVHLGFEPRADGVLLLTLVNPEVGALGVVESFELQTNAQCINVRGGEVATSLYLAVAADAVADDGDRRVDYTLRVVPTDLEAEARGACDRLNGGLYDYIDWPTAALD